MPRYAPLVEEMMKGIEALRPPAIKEHEWPYGRETDEGVTVIERHHDPSAKMPFTKWLTKPLPKVMIKWKPRIQP